jgi:hypothetical protein
MKQLCARLLVIAVAGGLLASAGCVYNNTDLVITENVCVNLEETQTTDNFGTFVVADKFAEQLEKKLKEYGKSTKDVKAIHMTSATFKAMSVKPHDWVVDCNIEIGRQDVEAGPFEDGPAPFVTFTDQSLKALTGAPNQADMAADGVDVVNRALASLLNGEDPRMVMLVKNESVTPVPSVSDPMEFKILACVKFQIVVDAGKKGGKK